MLKTICFFVFTPLVLISCKGHHADASENSKHVLAQAKGAILRAEGNEALNLLSQANEDELSLKDLTFLNCATERLSGLETVRTPDASSALLSEILPVFRAYWTGAIINSEGHDQAERELDRQLSAILEIDDTNEIEPTIVNRLQSNGLYALMGRTGRLRELMIWRTQNEEIQRVELPEGEVSTTVFYLDDFISTGWSSYFSCDALGTGGWARNDGLYVVVPRWKNLDEERFRVSLLAHESQHFQDYIRFPDLIGWELEYRAKLVELALAEADQAELIKHFTANQGDDKDDAHSNANREVMKDLRAYLNVGADAPLEFDSVSIIQSAANELLKRDSRRLQAQDAVGE